MAVADVRTNEGRRFSRESRMHARLANSFVLKGTNPSITGNAGDVFFLQYVKCSGNYTVNNGDGDAMTGTVTTDFAPPPDAELWSEAGMSITGTVLIAIGYVIRGLPVQKTNL